jgi:hypothetical protein
MDEYNHLSSHHREYTLALLKRWGTSTLGMADGKLVKMKAGRTRRWKGGGRKPVCGPKAAVCLCSLRAFFWCKRGKFLSPLIRSQMPFFENQPDFHITAGVKAKLLRISPAAINRALQKGQGRADPAVTKL